MPQLIGRGRPLAQIAGLHAAREALVGGAVAQCGDRRDLITASGAVREVQEPAEPHVVVGGDRGHPAVAERGFELVFLRTDDGVNLVQQQHERQSGRSVRRAAWSCGQRLGWRGSHAGGAVAR